MVLIADSGSTKTDWRLVTQDGIVEAFTSVGINPTLQTLSEVRKEQLLVLKAFTHLPVKRIEFYGAGCAQKSAQVKIEQTFKPLFPDANILVFSDLLGAAKAVFDRQSGIACILGTGSNSGYYDGEAIVENIPSLGYLLGDEGGGSLIGKQLLADYLRGNMPVDLSDLLKIEIGDDRASIYHRLYQSPFPNRFLASIVGLIGKSYSKDAYFCALVKTEFDRFFVNCINNYDLKENVLVGFVGSLAFYFQDILKSVANNHSVNVSGIIEKPIDALASQCLKHLPQKLFYSRL